MSAAGTAAPAAMKTLTLTSSQLDDLRAGLVEHRNRLERFAKDATHGCTKAYWDGQISRYDALLLLVAKA